jgi:hypothetical protein
MIAPKCVPPVITSITHSIAVERVAHVNNELEFVPLLCLEVLQGISNKPLARRAYSTMA